jgi:hypothetical protein
MIIEVQHPTISQKKRESQETLKSLKARSIACNVSTPLSNNASLVSSIWLFVGFLKEVLKNRQR